MRFLKKKWFVFAVFLLIFSYTTLRLYNITALPIFTDEAIYIRWTQYLLSDHKFWDYSITDGKQPMLIWLSFLLMEFISDPLLAGRLVSVFAGLISMVGIFFLTQELYKSHSKDVLAARKMALLASFIYLIFPFALVYDRLALYDSLVSMFIIWSLYFEVLLARYVRLDIAIILGMIMGGGMLTKTNTSFAMILLPISLLLFNFNTSKQLRAGDGTWKKRLGIWTFLAFVAVVIATIIYSTLRLSPFFHIISQKNYTFIYTPQEILQNPFIHLFGNLQGMFIWLIGYVTVPFLVLVVSAFFTGKKYIKENLLLFAWFVVPFFALALFGRTIYPRFILFMTMPLLVMGSFALFNIVTFSRKSWMKALAVFVFLVSFIFNDFFVVTDFARASIPEGDREQLITSWPAGGGVRETVEFLNKQAETQKIYVGTQGTFGLMPYALEIYVKDNPNINTKGFWPVGDVPPQEVLDSAKKMPTYFVFYQSCSTCPQTGVAPVSWPVKQIFQIQKLEKGSFYTLYKIMPQ